MLTSATRRAAVLRVLLTLVLGTPGLVTAAVWTLAATPLAVVLLVPGVFLLGWLVRDTATVLGFAQPVAVPRLYWLALGVEALGALVWLAWLRSA